LQWTPESQAFWFDAGALCLELLTTGGELSWGYEEFLHTPQDVQAWARACRLNVEALEIDDEGIEGIRALREAVWNVTKARLNAEKPASKDIDRVNAFAAASAVPQLDATLRKHWQEPMTADQFAGMIARDTIELFSGPYAERVRQCEGHCELVFVDTSRPGKRRWCSMQRCGNRAKIREFRDRQRTEGAS
jgi:predicted RNA-binding Zn ribbon-like protein